jgi:hypothetical protein
MKEIRFDDIAGLNALVGQDFGPWGKEVHVTQEMIDRFADLTGDRQWIHVDVERCKRESPFGGPIAHGFLTLSLLPAMQGEANHRIVGYGNATNYGAESLRFLTPVPAGARVRAHARVKSVEARPRGTLVASEIAVHVVGQERPALLYNRLVLYLPKKGA